MMTEEQYKKGKAKILKLVFVDGLHCREVAEILRNDLNLDYEEVAYRMDEEGVFS